jgi:hypothetical protein
VAVFVFRCGSHESREIWQHAGVDLDHIVSTVGWQRCLRREASNEILAGISPEDKRGDAVAGSTQEIIAAVGIEHLSTDVIR